MSFYLLATFKMWSFGQKVTKHHLASQKDFQHQLWLRHQIVYETASNTENSIYKKSDNFSLMSFTFNQTHFIREKWFKKSFQILLLNRHVSFKTTIIFRFGIFVIDLAVLIIQNLVIFNVNSEARSQFSSLSKNGIFVIDLVVTSK